MNKSVKTPHSVIAATRDDAEFKAVEVHKQDGVVEVLWTKRLSGEDRTWSEFAVQCGLVPDAGTQRRASKKHAVSVVGLNSTAVAFYKISAPSVGKEETAAIVRMQAESLLPLSPDQIEVAWRTTASTNGQADITIAAARKDYLYRFAHSVRDFRPRAILLSCEGTAKVWQCLFSEQERQALLVSIDTQHTQVCLVQNGRVTHAAVLDTGMNDLVPVGSRSDLPEPPEVMERFAQDMRTVFDSFGWEESTAWPMVVLSDGNEAIDRIVASLNVTGLHAKTSLPAPQNLRMPQELDMQDIYEYRVPLGLAMMALEGPSQGLDLFEGISEDEALKRRRSAWYSVALAGAIATIMLVALVVVAYAVDAASERHLGELVNQARFEQARQQQRLLTTVARHRPDMLQLLTDINSGENNGIVLDSLYFKKGQTVTLMGQAGNMEQMWKYQSTLLGHKGIADVEISNASRDSKTKKIKFTMTFHYKSFTKKNAVL